jgi:hypothetical protein
MLSFRDLRIISGTRAAAMRLSANQHIATLVESAAAACPSHLEAKHLEGAARWLGGTMRMSQGTGRGHVGMVAIWPGWTEAHRRRGRNDARSVGYDRWSERVDGAPLGGGSQVGLSCGRTWAHAGRNRAEEGAGRPPAGSSAERKTTCSH